MNPTKPLVDLSKRKDHTVMGTLASDMVQVNATNILQEEKLVVNTKMWEELEAKSIGDKYSDRQDIKNQHVLNNTLIRQKIQAVHIYNAEDGRDILLWYKDEVV